MKTYNEIKKERLENLKEGIKRQQDLIDKAKFEKEKDVYGRIILEIQRDIENIDEVTRAYIGYETNQFFKDMSWMINRTGNDYFEHHDMFLDMLLGNRPDREGKNSKFGAGLGITKEDLACFRGKAATSDETQDAFRTYVNNQLGTNIPLSKDMEMMEIYRYSQNRDDYVRFANLSIDSGDAYHTIGTSLVADRIEAFDKTHNQQTTSNTK